MEKLMYCKVNKCKLTQAACIARKALAKKQVEDESQPKPRGRPRKKNTFMDLENCLKCTGGLRELRPGQEPGITDEGLGAKTCKKCEEEKSSHYFERGKDICILCAMRKKEEAKENIEKEEKKRKKKDLEDFIEAETTSDRIKADVKKVDDIKRIQPDGILQKEDLAAELTPALKDLADYEAAESIPKKVAEALGVKLDGMLLLNLNLVVGLKDALKKAADEGVRTVEQQALFVLKVALHEEPAIMGHKEGV